MAAWWAMLVVWRKRHTSSTEKFPDSDSATVAGWRVSQKACIVARSSLSRAWRASGVKRGCDMGEGKGGPSAECGVPTHGTTGDAFCIPRPSVRPDRQVVDEPGGPELDRHGQQEVPPQALDRLQGVRIDHGGVVEDRPG